MVNEKDVMRKLKYFAGIAAALMLWGCSEDKFVPDQYLNGLGGDEYVLNEIDEWIIDNYTEPAMPRLFKLIDDWKVLGAY